MTTEPSTALATYVDKAVAVLRKFEILPVQGEESQLVALLEDVRSVDEPAVVAIGSVLQHMGTYNALVREKVGAMHVADRYNTITDGFNQVREDARTLVDQLEDGKIDWKERLRNAAVRLTRGSPMDQFDKIRGAYLEVAEDVREQLEREQEIMEGYINFRFAVKGSEGVAYGLMQKQEAILQQAQRTSAEASTAVSEYKGGDAVERSGLELTRDQAASQVHVEDRRFQLIKDLAENLAIGYNVGDALVARLRQVHGVKEQVYRRAVTFFTTNEHAFTTLAAIYTSLQGLNEQTRSAEAMRDGIEGAIEDVATLGTAVATRGLEAGYGKTIDASVVSTLVSSIVAFQEESRGLIATLRQESAENAAEIARIVDDGKERYRRAMEKFQAPAVTPAS